MRFGLVLSGPPSLPRQCLLKGCDSLKGVYRALIRDLLFARYGSFRVSVVSYDSNRFCVSFSMRFIMDGSILVSCEFTAGSYVEVCEVMDMYLKKSLMV